MIGIEDGAMEDRQGIHVLHNDTYLPNTGLLQHRRNNGIVPVLNYI